MHLIFGGAYQGKLDYAKAYYQFNEEDIYYCISIGEERNKSFLENEKSSSLKPEIDFSRKAVYKLEEFILSCVRCRIEAKDYLKENRESWKDTIFICTDISAGIVPCEPELRLWREMVGRVLMYLGKEAEEVTRMFCGIPQRIK